MPSPIHRLVRTLTESKGLGKLLDSLPPQARDALEYFASDPKHRQVFPGWDSRGFTGIHGLGFTGLGFTGYQVTLVAG